MRTQFAFYKSFDDVYQDLNDKQKLEFIEVLLDVQFLRTKIEDVSFKDNILKHIWNAQKHSINKSISGYLDSQKNSKIKEPYMGVYDPLNIPSKGIHKEEKEEEEEKEEHTASIENEFQSLWKGYTLTFLKKQNRKGGSKAKAKANFIKLRKKYDNEAILKMVRSHASQKIGHKDLERLLLEDYIKQHLEDNNTQEQQAKTKELKVIGE